jgi:hypothetical protein
MTTLLSSRVIPAGVGAAAFVPIVHPVAFRLNLLAALLAATLPAGDGRP